MKVASTPTMSRRPINVARTVAVPADAARRLLVADAAAFVVASPPSSAEAGRRQVGVRLMGHLHLRREVTIGIGPLIEEDDGTMVLPVWWEAAEFPRLFPTFDGGLEVGGRGDGTELRLVGSCQPPLGRFGAFGDEIAGYKVARATLEAFIEEVADLLVERHSKALLSD
jgi:hypothetical protein